MVLAAFGYVWYLEKSVRSLSNPSSLIASPKLSSEPNTTPSDSCAQFKEKFGTSAEELVDFINNEPDSAVVLKGYRLIYGQITGLTPRSYFPIIFNLDSNAKVVSVRCEEPSAARDYSKDIDFTIPETDFAQIVRYRETLETDQTSTYLQNVKTTPELARQIILERIQSLGN